MRPENWFFAVQAPERAGSTVAAHLQRLEAKQAGCELRDFALAGGPNATVLYASAGRVVESDRFWLFVAGPRPPDAHLQSALRRARSDHEVERLCISPGAADHSFLVIDKQARTFSVITDRLNVSKVFHAEIDGLRLLSSHITTFPRPSLTIDLGAVASYLLNGACHNNRTIFGEIALLDRAAVHEFRPNGRHAQIYWEYAPGRAMTGEPWQPQAAEAELWELIVQSVDKATRGKRVVIALSGGYDSAVLLGVLGGAIRHPDVICFSYAHGAPKEDSDVTVAARRAALYGYRHMTFGSYAGDLLRMLDCNAAVAQSLRCPSYEIAAFQTAAEQLGVSDECVVLFGDHSFGLKSFRQRNPEELLGAIGLRSPALLNGLEPGIAPGQLERLRAALEGEHGKLLEKARIYPVPDDAKDFLFVDQRLQFNLLPLRTFIAGHWLPVAMPLLDPDILDFVATVPTTYRLDKRLFRQMARRFLPKMFRIQRATAAQAAPDFNKEIAAARQSLESAIVERGWKVDGLVNPEDLVRLLTDFCASTSKGGTGEIRGILKAAAKRLVAKSRFLEDRQQLLRRLVYNEFARVPGRWFLLLNLLCLADFLADRPPPSVTEGKPLT